MSDRMKIVRNASVYYLSEFEYSFAKYGHKIEILLNLSPLPDSFISNKTIS